jgi:anaphase-promoting complex subunit 6
MAAYRSAARLFPGLHQPLLGMAMEYARMNNLPLAEQLAQQAHERCPWDPLNCHEIGVLAYKARKYDEAQTWLQKTLNLIPQGRMNRGVAHRCTVM